MSHYNFDENLISLSKSNNIENSKKEWRFAFYNIRDDRCGKCICNKTHLKHVYLYRNKNTGEYIECGKGCMIKHNLWKPPSNKKGGILKTIKYINIRVGWSQPYTKFNHNEYIKNVVVSFKKIVENSDYEKLLELLDMFDFVISESATFDNEQILNLRNDINKKLFEIQKKREEKKRIQEEARKIQEEALEKERKIRETKWEKERKIREATWEKERLEREKERLEREKEIKIEQEERRQLYEKKRREQEEKRLEQEAKYLKGEQILNFGIVYPDK